MTITKIQLRRGTAAQWASVNPTLSSGEPGMETDTLKLKIGDGATAWNSLAYTSGSAGATGPTGAPGGTGATGNTGARGVNYVFYGSGADGDVEISSGTTILSRNMFYNNLTLSGTGVLVGRGWQVFVYNTLDLSNAAAGAITATPAAAGGNASGYTGGAGSTSRNNTFQINPESGTAGKDGTTGTGGQAGGIYNNTDGSWGGANGASATGGAGAVYAAGNGWIQRVPSPRWILTIPRTYYPVLPYGGMSAAGGGGGGGDGINKGGGGGGGGAGGNVVLIFAYEIKTGASTPAGAISSNGSNGGDGGTPATGDCGGGGGAGGGGGGWIYIVFSTKNGSAVTGLITANGGNGGTGGNGVGGGNGAGGGDGGGGGRIMVINTYTGTITTGADGAGTTGSAAAGITGGTGGIGSTLSISL
jgi:hypothetical protein